jgi:serine/threonine-protein kinase
MSEAHPGDAALRALLAADAGDAPEIEAHLEGCAVCRVRLEQMAGAAEFAHDFAPYEASPDVAALALLQPSAEDGSLGRLGRFEVVQWLATAGTAIVWRARDPRDGSEVALKVLQPLLAAQREYRARFFREAAAVMQIQHASVLPVLEVDEEHEPPFLVMPFMRGGSL